MKTIENIHMMSNSISTREDKRADDPTTDKLHIQMNKLNGENREHK